MRTGSPVAKQGFGYTYFFDHIDQNCMYVKTLFYKANRHIGFQYSIST